MILRKTKDVFLLALAGANATTVVLMMLCAASSLVNPVHFQPLVFFTLSFPAYLFVNAAFLFFWLVFRRRYAAISIIGFASCFFSVRAYFPLNVPQPHPRGCIKVMSYNVEGFLYNLHDSKDKVNQMLHYIRESGADILCLQEMMSFPDHYGNQIDSVLRHWPYRYRIRTKTNNAYGIYSRFPILKRMQISFPSDTHGSIACEIRMGRDTIYVINNHFVSNAISGSDKTMYKGLICTPGDMSLKSDLRYLVTKVGQAGVKRAEQADSVYAYLKRIGDKPVILCGDFNDSPISYVHHTLTRQLKDAYVSSANGPGISYHESGMYFRLDNILCSHHWTSYSATVDSHMGLSDHYPIYCFLKKKIGQ